MKNHSHNPHDIEKRLSQPASVSYLRDWIYGGIDGVITTFAIVSSVVGANLNAYIIIVLGLANIVADGFSMAASNYLGTKSEVEEYEHYKHMEQSHMKHYPQGEKQEIETIFRRKGFRGSVLNKIVDAIVANEDLWLETMLREEHGLPAQIRQPWKAALATFSAFLLCGIVPLLSYVIGLAYPFYWSLGLTALTFIAIGSIKSRWSIHSWWYSGLTTLAVGGVAAALAFVVGYMFRL